MAKPISQFWANKRTPPKTPGHFPQSARRVPECPLAAHPVLQSQAAAPLSGGQLLAIFLRNGLIQRFAEGTLFRLEHGFGRFFLEGKWGCIM